MMDERQVIARRLQELARRLERNGLASDPAVIAAMDRAERDLASVKSSQAKRQLS